MGNRFLIVFNLDDSGLNTDHDILLAEIMALHQARKKVFATNKHFQKVLRSSIRHVQKVLHQLVQSNYIIICHEIQSYKSQRLIDPTAKAIKVYDQATVRQFLNPTQHDKDYFSLDDYLVGSKVSS